MKVLILTFGTRGDVQPFVALARALKACGHDTVLAAPQRFAGFVGEHDVTFAAVDDGPLRLMDAAHGVGETMTAGIRGRIEQARAIPATFIRVLEDCAAIATGPGAGADVVVHNGQIIAGQHIAEKLSVPAVLALTLPMYVPTREFPWPGQALPHWLPAAVNRATFLGMRAPALMFGRTVDRWRERTLGLPRRPGRHDPLIGPDGGPAPVLNAVSRHVLPPPADWPPTVTTTGYWFLPPRPNRGPESSHNAGLPDELAAFLDAGDPPVFVGFGSMAGPDPRRTTEHVVAAIARAGVRAVLATGWGGLTATQLPDGVIAVDQAPHELMLPRTAAVVHHGGAGTTGAAAAAGRPQVVCPFVADQPFWGRRMHTLGVAPAPLNQNALTADALAAAIDQAVTDPTINLRAGELGDLIRSEQGIAAAVRQLETLVGTVGVS